MSRERIETAASMDLLEQLGQENAEALKQLEDEQEQLLQDKLIAQTYDKQKVEIYLEISLCYFFLQKFIIADINMDTLYP